MAKKVPKYIIPHKLHPRWDCDRYCDCPICKHESACYCDAIECQCCELEEE